MTLNIHRNTCIILRPVDVWPAVSRVRQHGRLDAAEADLCGAVTAGTLRFGKHVIRAAAAAQITEVLDAMEAQVTKRHPIR
jgi:hypothetical protein